jgi:hypothetical protein
LGFFFGFINISFEIKEVIVKVIDVDFDAGIDRAEDELFEIKIDQIFRNLVQIITKVGEKISL